jgi:membrane protein DedA with SNARE-associated domain
MKHLHRYVNHIFSTDLIAPLLFIVFYIVFLIVIKNVAPSSEEIIAHAQSLYARYGYELIFAGAAAEGLILVNFLAPGSLTVGLGAIFSKTGTLDLTLAIFFAFCGAMSAYLVDYLLGYFGFSKIIYKLGYGQILDAARKKLEVDPIQSFSFGFIHPNIGAMVALAAGASKLKFGRFLGLSALSSAGWVTFWGLLIYVLGDIFLKIFSKYFLLIVIVILAFWVLSILYNKRVQKTGKS